MTHPPSRSSGAMPGRSPERLPPDRGEGPGGTDRHAPTNGGPPAAWVDPARLVLRQAPVVNAANVLTALRLVLVPVFVALTIASDLTDPGLRIASALTFAVAAATDFVDGWIARTWNLVTSFGKVADPIADKALTGAALLLLSSYDLVSWWVTGVILLREFGVTALRFWVIRRGVIAASRGGKVKTAMQSLAIGWYLWPFSPPVSELAPWLMGIALVATVVTGADYTVRAIRLRRTQVVRPG
jgi:CDP-diacylglycerol---glycerol-3-phosphate 3-phosphatidyltransferase